MVANARTTNQFIEVLYLPSTGDGGLLVKRRIYWLFA